MKYFTFAYGVVITSLMMQGCDSTSLDVARPDGSRPTSSVKVNVFNDVVAATKEPPQAAATGSTNLLSNPGFESGQKGWVDCAPGATVISTDAYEGKAALSLKSNNCIYRSIESVPGRTYVLSCAVKLTENKAWTGMGMVFANGQYKSLSDAPVAVATSGSYTTLVSKGVAPAKSSFVSMWLHSDHGALIDNCSLVLEADQPTVTPVQGNLISNGGFTKLDANGGANDWASGCGGEAIADGTSIYLADGTCVDQAVSVGAIESIKNNDVTFGCHVSEVEGYADLSLFLNNKVAQFKRIEQKHVNTVVSFTVKADEVNNGFVSLYSEGYLKVDECSLIVAGTPTIDPGVDTDPTDNTDTNLTEYTAVVFESAHLETLVRKELETSGLNIEPTAPLTRANMAKLTKLVELRGGAAPSINNLTGLEYAINLEELWFWGGSVGVQDLAPLSELTKLRRLQIDSDQIVDISALANLKSLEVIWLEPSITFSDLSPLAGLTELSFLVLDTGGTLISPSALTDLSPLQGLNKLESLSLYDTSVADVSPVASLPKLKRISLLSLGYNPVDSLQALADGTFSSNIEPSILIGLSVDLSANSPNLIALHALQDRGVLVELYVGIRRAHSRVLPAIDVGR